MKIRTRRRSVLACSTALAVMAALAAPVAARAQAATYSFDIPAQDLGSALRAFGRQARQQIAFDGAVVRGKTSAAVVGRMAPDEALGQLLAGTGLQVGRTIGGVLVVRGENASPPDQAADPSAATSAQVSELTVTGTRIRGVAPSSPVITLTAQSIRAAGQTDLGQAVRSLPQSFNGGQNPGVSVGAPGIANQNLNGASSVNLRGLGPDATLTLLNGRRLSYDAFTQAVDISSMPLAAVDRVQVLLDGASAIYGSDAVAGVTNVILKRDFRGLTALARVGGATDGGAEQQQYNAVGGWTWSTGGFIAAYDFEKQRALMSRQRDYLSYMADPSAVMPASRQSSSFLSAHQDLGSFAHLSLDALYTFRSNYLLLTEPGVRFYNKPHTTIWALSPTLAFDLLHNWTVSVNAVTGVDHEQNDQPGFSTVTNLQISSSKGCYCNSERGYEVSGEGPLFSLPGGDVRLALGAGSRWNGFDQPSYTSPSSGTSGSRRSAFAYAEANLPIIGPEQDLTFVERLTVDAAVRYESYNDIGDVTTPKLGAVWAPVQDLDVKVSWGKSFKAPTLLQEYSARTGYIYPGTTFGVTTPGATVLIDYGGQRNLSPERATTWTAGVVFHPRRIPGLRGEVSYFHIDYTDRVLQPVTNLANALADPAYAPFVTRSPTSSAAQALLASVDRITKFIAPAYDPATTVAIVEDRYTNISAQALHGIDLSLNYDMAAFTGDLTLVANASWLRGSQRSIPGAPLTPIVGVISEPTHFRGRAGALWRKAGFTGSAFVNYVGGEADIRSIPNPRVNDMTTFDLSLDYRFADAPGLLRDLEVQVSASNLFDRAPPFARALAFYVVDYDSTNYSALGRVVSLTVSKHW